MTQDEKDLIKTWFDHINLHKLDYNGARFATREESKEFYDKLTGGGYKFVDGHVIAAPDNTPETKKSFKKSFKHKGFTYIEDLQQWVNEQRKIEVVSVAQVSSSNFVVFYYELL